MRRILALLMVAIMIFSFSGCGQKEENVTPESSPEKVQEEKEDLGWYSEYYDAEAMKDVTLNMYGVTDTIRPVLDQFQEDTGIKIENLTMKNGEILQRLKNEKESGIGVADIWFTGGADTFINAAQSGLLVAYKSSQGEVLADVMKDEEGYWHGTSLTLVNWVVNKQLIEEKGLKMPETWEDLLQEGLKGQVSMSNPASSGTAYNVVSAILQTKGEEEGWRYIDKLIGQVPFFTARGSDPARFVVNGEAIVGINASNGDRDLEENNAHIKLVYPKDGTGWWPQPVAIVEGTKNLDAAKVFIDWLLSKRGMETLAKVRNAAVARTDVETPEGIVDIKTIKLFMSDFKANAEKRDETIEEWKKHVE
ncbi:ABC transporter substrate-binding protein [Wukongibacter sp. M2B1]|uniref:ABC transporter substrate-binding protein n=1 Tax=Wukongibacter sp. M2B1 TaxID=3088895 RepID=UPI003D7B090D